jgi:hypothetical protein
VTPTPQVYFILLNILLAIIVDSYSHVKDEIKNSGAQSLPAEVFGMFRTMFRGPLVPFRGSNR